MIYATRATAALAVLLLTSASEAVIKRFVDPELRCSSGSIAVYATIQDAVDAAAPGEVIDVCAGNYPEQVDVTTSNLTILGRIGAHIIGPGFAVANAAGLNISASGVVIGGFEVSGFLGDDACGIRALGTSDVDIRRNSVHHNRFGICIEDSNTTRARLNEAHASFFTGILVLRGHSNKIADNDVSESGLAGIFVERSDGVVIERNESSRNSREGIFVFVGEDVIVRHNVTRDNGEAGITISSTTRAIATANRMIGNRTLGLILGFSGAGVVRANHAEANGTDGISLFQTGNSLVIHNFSLDNVGNGISAQFSSTGDTYTRNFASRNNTAGDPGLADCNWDGSDAPTFELNRCATQLPLGAWKQR